MPTNSSLDLQRFYPDELEIVSIEEDSDEIRLHMRSRSKSFSVQNVVKNCVSCMPPITGRFRIFRFSESVFFWHTVNRLVISTRYFRDVPCFNQRKKRRIRYQNKNENMFDKFK